MPNLNIRNVDKELLKALKMKAITENKTLRDYVLDALDSLVSPTKKG